MKITSNEHNLICACETCRKTKGITFKEKETHYALKQHKISGEYKYFPLETCHFCGEGYIIETKLFDRCVKCGKDVKS